LIRVLFLTESFYPVLGGAEQHLLRLATRLAAEGWGTTVVTRRGKLDWAPRETLDEVRIVRVPPSGSSRRGKYLMLPFAAAAVFREMGRHDLLVVRGTRVLGLPGLVAARARNRQVILQAEVNGEMSGEIYTWGTPLARGWTDRAVRAVTRLRNHWLRDADAFVAMSRLITDEFQAAGVPPERLAFIPHGVDCNRFAPATDEERAALRSRLGIPASAVVATYTGRLLRGKGLEDLVEAFGRLAAREPELRLFLVGSGGGQALSVEDQLWNTVQAAGLGARVSFTGRVAHVEDHLRASDVFVFPSEFEALGLSLVEAAACGLPCIGARTGGIVDVIEDGSSGLLVPPGDPDALTQALGSLAADAGRRKALGAGARAVALERFDEEDALARYKALFREVVGAAGRGAA
jgi:glycosyltransferase involved in cell wall biosynthesis